MLLDYKAPTDEELDKLEDQIRDEAIEAIEELDLPHELIEEMVRTVWDFDYEQMARAVHYSFYEDYVENYGDEVRLNAKD